MTDKVFGNVLVFGLNTFEQNCYFTFDLPWSLDDKEVYQIAKDLADVRDVKVTKINRKTDSYEWRTITND